MNNYQRYLKSKKSLDDRSLNLRVWNEVIKEINNHKKTVSILEIGGGIGTMIARLLSEEISLDINYSILDIDINNINEAKRQIIKWGNKNKYKITIISDFEFLINKDQKRISLTFIPKDVYEYMDTISTHFDLLIAHAFLDLLDTSIAIPKIFNMIKPAGLFYFTINYDGLSIFEPIEDLKLESLILSEYNKTMDERITNGKRSGDSQTGRHLFSLLKKNKADIINAGSSDWLVFPQNGKYIADEEYFLNFIINTIKNALIETDNIPKNQLNDWVMNKQKQISKAELVYIAHQVDFFGRI